jgi:adhesin transport system membrane fusion protein
MKRLFLRLIRWFDFRRLMVLLVRPAKAIYNWALKLKHYRDEQRQLRHLSQSVFLEEAKIPDTFRIPIITLSFLIISFFASALFIKVDSVYKVTGKVISNHSDYIIKTHEDCILSEIFVSQGQLVEIGSELIRLDCNQSSVYNNEQALRTKILEELYKAFIEGRKPELDNLIWYDVDLIPEYQKTYDKLLSEYSNKINRYNKRCDNIEQELKNLEKKKDNIIRERDNEKRKILKNRLDEIELNLAKIENIIKQQESNLSQCKTDLDLLKKQEKDKIRHKLSTLDTKNINVDTKLDENFSIRSVVQGVVKETHNYVIGASIKKNANILTIKPIAHNPVIEVKIDPERAHKINLRDFAQVVIKHADEVDVLQGEIQYISEDLHSDLNDGTEYYVSKIKISQDSIPKKINLVPGREVIVSFATGQLTLFEYLLTPFTYESKNSMNNEVK